MYELIKVGEQSYYIESPARIGVYVENGTEAYLVDSGNDKDAGRKVKQILEANDWTLKAIINTHSNADHIGGNQYLKKQTGCKIFSRGIEAAFTQYPVLEPAFLFGGFPLKELQHKFLMAKPSEVTDISAADFPQNLSVIDLPGHFFDMIGIRTPDGVAFIADCLNSKETLDKYRFTFIYDVEAYLHTLEQVGKMQAKMFVPAHAKPTEDIKHLVEYNISKVYENAEFLTAMCKKPMNFETILQQVFTQYNLVMNYEQYALLGSTIKSYLSWLKNSGKLVTEFSDNMLLWNKA